MVYEVIVDELPVPFYDACHHQMDEMDTKALRQLQFELNLYIDRICTGEETGLDVLFCEKLLREISRNEFNDIYGMGELLRFANSQGSNAISALVLVAAGIARSECIVDDLKRVFGSSYTTWKFGQLAKSELFDLGACWREYDAAEREDEACDGLVTHNSKLEAMSETARADAC